MPLRVLAALLATWLLWGSAYLAIRIALPDFPPFFQMGTRFLTAGAILLTWARVQGNPWPTRTAWRDSVVLGVLLLLGGAGGTAYAEQTVPSGLVAGFISIEPALIVLGSLAFGQRVSWVEVAGIVVGLSGVALLIQGRGFAASPLGLWVMVAATISWSAGSLFAQRRLRSVATMTGSACQMVCGGCALLLLSVLAGESPHAPSVASMLAWSYLVVFGSVVAYSAFIYLLAHSRLSIAMSYTFVNPFVALVLGIAFAAEHISWRECFAVAAIALGVALLLLEPSSQHPPAGRE